MSKCRLDAPNKTKHWSDLQSNLGLLVSMYMLKVSSSYPFRNKVETASGCGGAISFAANNTVAPSSSNGLDIPTSRMYVQGVKAQGFCCRCERFPIHSNTKIVQRKVGTVAETSAWSWVHVKDVQGLHRLAGMNASSSAWRLVQHKQFRGKNVRAFVQISRLPRLSRSKR